MSQWKYGRAWGRRVCNGCGSCLTGSLNWNKCQTFGKSSETAPTQKEKRDIRDYAKYRGTKLMLHTIKVFKKIIDQRARSETQVGEGQFGFKPGRSTTDAVFSLRQLLDI